MPTSDAVSKPIEGPFEIAETRLEYGLRAAGEDLTWCYRDRKQVEEIMIPGDRLFVREVIITAWREVESDD